MHRLTQITSFNVSITKESRVMFIYNFFKVGKNIFPCELQCKINFKINANRKMFVLKSIFNKKILHQTVFFGK